MILAMIGIAGLALLVPLWQGWVTALLLVVPALAGFLVRRSSFLVALYQWQTSVYFGLISVVLGRTRPAGLVSAVLLWSIGLALGALLLRRSVLSSGDSAWSPPRWPHFVVATGLMAVQSDLVLSGQLGVQAQMEVGLSTPVGLAGILATTSPVVVLMVLMSALATRRHVTLASSLAVVQAVVLSLSGFRAAAVIFLLAVIPAAALTLPRNSPWRQPRRLLLACAVLVAMAVAGFAMGAVVKDRMATQVGLVSTGTKLFGWEDAGSVVVERLDLGSTLERAERLIGPAGGVLDSADRGVCAASPLAGEADIELRPTRFGRGRRRRNVVELDRDHRGRHAHQLQASRGGDRRPVVGISRRVR